MQPWKTLQRQTILNLNKYVTVENHTIQLPNGQIITDWAWLATPEYVNVAVLTTGGDFVCFR